jgi:hypothetical protein
MGTGPMGMARNAPTAMSAAINEAYTMERNDVDVSIARIAFFWQLM